MQVCISPLGIPKLFGDDPRAMIDVARLAERYGIDQLMVSDHVVMSEAIDKYPYGKFLVTPAHPFFEPLTLLAAIASVTERIRLSTGVIITPLRPAVFLAKQVATLDALSHGRVDLGIGTGWQKEEYDASGVPWEGRMTLLEEQVRACQALWRDAPASYHGTRIHFDRLYSVPFPRHRRVPIWFGVAPTERNIERIAELGDGWLPAPPLDGEPEKLAQVISSLRAAFEARGRDPTSLAVRALPLPVQRGDGAADLEATLAQIPAFARAGVTMVTFRPIQFCRRAEDVEPFLERIASVRGTGS